jgi:hypothetical protein
VEDSLNLDTVFRIKDEIAFRKANDGTMTIVSPVTDKIITINATATEIWEMIDGQKSVSEIVGSFIQIHSKDNGFPGSDEARSDVISIVDDFFNRKLIEMSGR